MTLVAECYKAEQDPTTLSYDYRSLVSFDYGLTNLYGFHGHSSNTYTIIHNHNCIFRETINFEGMKALKFEPQFFLTNPQI